MTMGIQQLMWAIERLGDGFREAVYSTRDLDAALATLGTDCVLVNLPMGTGADTADGLRRYLAEDVLPHLPADLTLRRVSRTVDQRRVAEETMVGFTHDRELPWLLPGIEPTHRHAEVLAISILSFRHRSNMGAVESRITAHRTLWDHAGLVTQLRLDTPAMATSRRASG